MNPMALLGILSIVYAGIVIGITISRPKSIWNMPKIKFFRDKLGEKGTLIFFYLWAAAFAILGFWLLIK